MDDFYSDLERGKRGEKLVIAALAARGHKITDVSDDWDYRRKDIDLLLVNKEQQQTTLEVKNEIRSETTGNIFIETYNSNNKSHSNRGWFFYCESQYICFLQENKGKAHIVALTDIKQAIENNRYRIANSSNAQGYLMPLADVEQMKSYFLLEL